MNSSKLEILSINVELYSDVFCQNGVAKMKMMHKHSQILLLQKAVKFDLL